MHPVSKSIIFFIGKRAGAFNKIIETCVQAGKVSGFISRPLDPIRPKIPVPPIPTSVFTPITLSKTSLNTTSFSVSDCVEELTACSSSAEDSEPLCSFLQEMVNRETRNGNYSLWSSHRVITQVEGNGTPQIPVDDIFRITGGGHGKVKHGNLIYAWQSEIVEPLVKKFSCRWISKGTIRVKRETLPDNSQWVGTLNYGQGDCDFLATLTINGEVHQIQLPH